MADYQRCLDLIVEQLQEKLEEEPMTIEDLHISAIILLNVKEREKMEYWQFTNKQNDG